MCSQLMQIHCPSHFTSTAGSRDTYILSAAGACLVSKLSPIISLTITFRYQMCTSYLSYKQTASDTICVHTVFPTIRQHQSPDVYMLFSPQSHSDMSPDVYTLFSLQSHSDIISHHMCTSCLPYNQTASATTCVLSSLQSDIISHLMCTHCLPYNQTSSITRCAHVFPTITFIHHQSPDMYTLSSLQSHSDSHQMRTS